MPLPIFIQNKRFAFTASWPLGSCPKLSKAGNVNKQPADFKTSRRFIGVPFGFSNDFILCHFQLVAAHHASNMFIWPFFGRSTSLALRLAALHDGHAPKVSHDRGKGAYGNWPSKGTQWAGSDLAFDFQLCLTGTVLKIVNVENRKPRLTLKAA
jgi:hypothetical protein